MTSGGGGEKRGELKMGEIGGVFGGQVLTRVI